MIEIIYRCLMKQGWLKYNTSYGHCLSHSGKNQIYWQYIRSNSTWWISKSNFSRSIFANVPFASERAINANASREKSVNDAYLPSHDVSIQPDPLHRITSCFPEQSLQDIWMAPSPILMCRYGPVDKVAIQSPLCYNSHREGWIWWGDEVDRWQWFL